MSIKSFKLSNIKNPPEKKCMTEWWNTSKTDQGGIFIMATNRSNNNNQLLVPRVQQALDQMKFEIATEFGVQLGPDTTSRANGSVGGEITKRLVRTAQQQLSGQFPQQ